MPEVLRSVTDLIFDGSLNAPGPVRSVSRIVRIFGFFVKTSAALFMILTKEEQVTFIQHSFDHCQQHF